ncbi:hypothetical protein C922_05001 [Plasmodium inui San Antonio 1]|uniref:Uncharacterized protein n=1 Tax=Plasmodium inui San Antonio 1 TaxID=1237626 RepID=W7AH44_9APIC|nr:hypothetical protein C922_05001 [Plasmodium inui San Antonio 1]EUD64586.1 hypothetical protein C922_05001 [Plasmodium inui San Antonio 1]
MREQLEESDFEQQAPTKNLQKITAPKGFIAKIQLLSRTKPLRTARREDEYENLRPKKEGRIRLAGKTQKAHRQSREDRFWESV